MSYGLFYSPGACSFVPHVVLRELGLPFELSRVDLGNRTGDWMATNPKGYVPALRLPDGALLTETAVMIQYLAERAPEKKLSPAYGSWERVRFDETIVFITTELHKGMSPIYNPKAGPEFKASLTDRLTKRFAILGEMIAKTGHPFGDAYTFADPYAFWVLRQWKRNIQTPWPHASLADFYAKTLERPAVKAAVEAERIEV
jgi:glutathione S-transferase